MRPFGELVALGLAMAVTYALAFIAVGSAFLLLWKLYLVLFA